MNRYFLVKEESNPFTMREALAAFAVEMEGDLEANDNREGWEQCSKTYLSAQARKCLNQLDVELFEGTTNIAGLRAERVREHAVQCANYLMMIADNWGDLIPRQKVPAEVINIKVNLKTEQVTVDNERMAA